MKTKGSLRQQYRQQRQQLSAVEIQQRSEAVADKFFEAIPVKEIQVLHTYLPIGRQLELDPKPILDRLRQEHPHLKLVLSRTRWEQRQMEHVFWSPELVLEINEMGILEPIGGTLCPAAEIDAVLVPLLAFDRLGHRLGYGAGFYDRFLASCRPDLLSIGLSLFPPHPEELPGILPTDIPLTHCLTPELVFSF